MLSLPSRRAFLRTTAFGASAALLAHRPTAQAEPRKLGVALVGLGNYATLQLAPALQETQFCRLAGIVTGSPRRPKLGRSSTTCPRRTCKITRTLTR